MWILYLRGRAVAGGGRGIGGVAWGGYGVADAERESVRVGRCGKVLTGVRERVARREGEWMLLVAVANGGSGIGGGCSIAQACDCRDVGE